MKYIIDSIKQIIVNQKPSLDKQLRVRINGFEDPYIYEEVAKYFHNRYDASLGIVTKVSSEKMAQFSNGNIHNSAIFQLKQNDWVASKNSLTYYRNLPIENAQIIILMGTEVVEDQGGLSDCFNIDPSKIVSNLNGDYSKIFHCSQGEWCEDDSKCINKLCNDLFALVPLNICDLSDFADTQPAFDTIQEFINMFFSNLPRWGLCKQEENIPPFSKISRSEKKNIFQGNSDFISRKMFKTTTKKAFQDYIKKIISYKDQGGLYANGWMGWQDQNIKSFEEFSQVLYDFIIGRNIESNRKKLIHTDFAITEDILKIKLPSSGTNTKNKISQLYGEPLQVFLKAVISTICEGQDISFEKIRIIFSDIELANAIDQSFQLGEAEQIAEKWQKLCCFTGGLFDFLNDRCIEYNDKELTIECETANIFSPNCASEIVSSGIVSLASASKKMSKVCFTVDLENEQSIVNHSKKFAWVFSLSDCWILMFDQILESTKQNSLLSTNFIPLSTVNSFSQLINTKSSEEFYDLLSQTTINHELNLLDFYRSRNYSTQNSLWLGKFSEIGSSFQSFIETISNNGFYFDLAKNPNSKINGFIDDYVKLGSDIVNSTMDIDQDWAMDMYIHSFAIEESLRAITHNEDIMSCIIPPYHPSILQKIVEQSVFIVDGCKEWLKVHAKNRPISLDQIEKAINEIEQLCEISEGIDIFPAAGESYFGSEHVYGYYCLCGKSETSKRNRLKNLLEKDSIYDEDFKKESLKTLDASSSMILDILESYIKAMPNVADNLSIAIINPDELQPIVAALHHYIEYRKDNLSNTTNTIQMRVKILVPPEFKGGRNYLTYWVNTFFSQDENVVIKIFFNEWQTEEDVKEIIDQQVDLAIVMNVLKQNRLGFSKEIENPNITVSDCRYPIVFRPYPVEGMKTKRKISLTQEQFSASTIHSQVVYYSRNFESAEYQKERVVKEFSFDSKQLEIVTMLHNRANWVVCIDSGMDGALLRSGPSANTEYSIIGYSTGKGTHGQYNVTITARKSMVDSVRKQLEARLRQAFHWNEQKTKQAATICIQEASKLDGVSLFKAINRRDHKINEFLAYTLLSLQMNRIQRDADLHVLIHLDSYSHWFHRSAFEQDIETNSLPDFLLVSIKINEQQKIELYVTVIECKIAEYERAQERIAEAKLQVFNGIKRLKRIFDPNSKSVRRRYWYAQLYRALSFSQVTFSDNSEDARNVARVLDRIIDGNFSISWDGIIMGYWKDWNADTEKVNKICDDPAIEIHNVPQLLIQRILLNNDNEDVQFSQWADEENEDPSYGFDVDVSFPDDNDIDTQMVDKSNANNSNHNETPQPESDRNTSTEETLIYTTPGDDNNLKSLGREEKPEKETKTISDLANIRVLVGKDKLGNDVYWDFGHPKLPNRHLLITGTSGQGKTYSIQTMLKELAECGISSVIFDYTEGFRLDQLEKPFINALRDKIQQHVIYSTGVPINPFRRHEIEVAGMKMTEKVSDVAQRIANIFSHVYDFKEQQFSAIYEACREGLEQYGEAMNMSYFKQKLANSKNIAAKTVLSKMSPFLDSVEFKHDVDFDWNGVTHSSGTITIFQLTNYVREIQVIITELMLWDAWHYNKKYGNKDTPFVVVLDEAQNLSHKSDSPSAMILTEGRKFGWSAWFATQSLKVLDDDEIVRLQQASFKLYFKPTDDELTRIAKQLDPSIPNGGPWVNNLKHLNKGQAIVVGDRVKADGIFGHVGPTITSISSFEERK